MERSFKDCPTGLFRRHNGICYVKFSDTQACMVTNGEVIEPEPDEIVYVFDADGEQK